MTRDQALEVFVRVNTALAALEAARPLLDAEPEKSPVCVQMTDAANALYEARVRCQAVMEDG